MKFREYNFDFLRVISMISVIMIHVSAFWVQSFIDNNITFSHLYFAFLYNSISRFAVPCFLMLSGAFLLADDKIKEYDKFYRKIAFNIGLPTLIFSICYILLRFIWGEGLFTLIKDFFYGRPFYHMWYLFMVFGVYMMAPFIVVLKDFLGEKNFFKFSITLLFICIISGWLNNTSRLEWGIDRAICYISYFIIGYTLKKSSSKNNFIGWFYILFGFILEIILSFVSFYIQVMKEIPESVLPVSIVGPLSPIVAVASVSIFVGISKLNFPRVRLISNLSIHSFNIFLIHGGIIWILEKVVFELLKINKIELLQSLDVRIIIPLLTILVLLLSWILSNLIQFLLSRVLIGKIA
ncbi:TPA: acyltransferase family protein [Streptococcus suis]|nr:acyltransferase family protein [Streptococcus suis]